MTARILPGNPFPLGATWDGKGVNFAIYSETAKKAELCLFEENSPEAESERITLKEVIGYVWHAYLPGISPGQLYAYRIYGDYRPEAGIRTNPAKLLLDPYAKAVSGNVNWDAPIFGYKIGDPGADLSKDDQDDAGGVPRSVVIDPSFDWGSDRAPRIPWHDTVIYETHVKGFTYLHPIVPPEKRGTYAGLASEAATHHLKSLGITAVELMPVHEILDEHELLAKGLKDYWGYNTLNYFSPAARYSGSGDRGGQVREFKSMVKAFHQAGMEVILDVVYNHTCEGNHLGPTLCFRGIDNPAYYRLVQGKERYYMDYTGTGNSLNVRQPQVLKLIMDSLRYWVSEMHVDGFRFDLAATLARELHEVAMLSSFFDVIHQDPVLSSVKLIAEPWDLGPGGYLVGKFPILWTEWNGKYRDAVRKFWRGDDGQMSGFAYRLTGSSDLYQENCRQPTASINFITAHDGFSLNDLVSYNQKHNEANGEGNRDGTDNNLSWNCGAEGPTDNPDIIALRERQKRNFLATLFFSQGVPMMLGGDEVSRSKRGNNNSYCQDNEISWFDWNMDLQKQELLEFTRKLSGIRKAHPNLHRRKFFQGRPIRGQKIRDIIWLKTDGTEMTDQDWNAIWVKCIGIFLDGKITDEYDENGKMALDDNLLLVLNSYSEPLPFKLPAFLAGKRWEAVIDTSTAQVPPPPHRFKDGGEFEVPGRTLILFRQPVTTEERQG